MTGLRLDAFRPRVVTVVINDEVTGEELLTCDLAALPWSEYHRISETVPEPDRPLEKGFDKKANQIKYKPKTDGPEYDAWVKARAEAEAERRRRRLAVSLIRAGNLPELKDATLEEQADAINEMDTGIVRVLYKAMDDLIWSAQQKVAQQADTFRTNGVKRAADLPA
jgi:hypothetical protein